MGGALLNEHRLFRTTWDLWREKYPDTVVLTEETGYIRNYDSDPYGGYYDSESTFYETPFTSDRHHPKRWVYGVRTAEGAVAFIADTLQAVGVIHGSIGESACVAVYDPTLDTAHVYDNPQEKTFEYDNGSIVDERGDEYEPGGLSLNRHHAFDAFWFAWVSYYPQTIVYE